MRKLLLFAIFVCFLVYASGCASIITGKYQKIPVTSEPPGVKVRSDTGENIITPGSFTLERNIDHTLVAEYQGMEPQQKQVKHGLQGWFWGNILFGGIIGGVIDLASGSCDELKPKKVHFDFTSAGQAQAKNVNAYLESHPDIEEEIKFAIQHGISAKGMTEEELKASLGKPDEIEKAEDEKILVYNDQTPSTYYFIDGKLEKAK